MDATHIHIIINSTPHALHIAIIYINVSAKTVSASLHRIEMLQLLGLIVFESIFAEAPNHGRKMCVR